MDFFCKKIHNIVLWNSIVFNIVKIRFVCVYVCVCVCVCILWLVPQTLFIVTNLKIHGMYVCIYRYWGEYSDGMGTKYLEAANNCVMRKSIIFTLRHLNENVKRRAYTRVRVHAMFIGNLER